ncbi:MAG: hydroxymethylbilane synthase [Bacteroidia bacterium]
MNITIGSRGSELALWQAHFVQAQLKKIGVNSEIKIIKTQGDKIQHLSFDKLEGKGFFTKEIEDALLNKEIDLAVHSHKDLPTENPSGLVIAAVSYREDPSEILLINKNAVDSKQPLMLKKNAVVGTSSARRKAQLLALRNDIELKDLRGNVPTRIQKLRDGNYDAIMLAAAGVERLNIPLEEFHVEKLSPENFIPAPAQGVLALQIREDDKTLFEVLQKLNHTDVQTSIAIERKVLNLFEGGCHMPLGAYCISEENEEEEVIFKLHVSMANAWDATPRYIYMESKSPETMAQKAVEKIKNIKPCSVFITRNQRKQDVFFDLLQKHNYTVHGISLIEIKQVNVKSFPDCDWVFFPSRHAVKYFFNQWQAPADKKIKFAVVGQGTSDELRQHGYRADFIGTSTDTQMIGKKFASIVKGTEIVLFPQAKGSLRSIQKQFVKPNQVIDVTVYETIKHPADELPQADILLFTSPSNVEAFFEKHQIKQGQKVIAMGGATGKALEHKGVKRYALPPSFDDLGLIKTVMSISS